MFGHVNVYLRIKGWCRIFGLRSYAGLLLDVLKHTHSCKVDVVLQGNPLPTNIYQPPTPLPPPHSQHLAGSPRLYTRPILGARPYWSFNPKPLPLPLESHRAKVRSHDRYVCVLEGFGAFAKDKCIDYITLLLSGSCTVHPKACPLLHLFSPLSHEIHPPFSSSLLFSRFLVSMAISFLNSISLSLAFFLSPLSPPTFVSGAD